MKGMQITVIGANSFLARNFVHQLQKPCSNVFLYDIDDCHKDRKQNYVKVDFSNKKDIQEKVNLDVDFVYIFMGQTGAKKSFTEYKPFIEVNEIYLLNVLSLIAETNTHPQIIYPSSRLVYKECPYPLKENALLEANTVYAVTKIASENYIKLYSKLFAIPYTIFRICVPFGTVIEGAKSYGTYNFFTTQAKDGNDITLYGDGSSVRTFTYIGDICKIMINVPLLAESKDEIFNIGGDTKTLFDIAKVIADRYHVGIKYVDWPALDALIEISNGEFDSAKLDKIYSCNYVSLEEYYCEIMSIQGLG